MFVRQGMGREYLRILESTEPDISVSFCPALGFHDTVFCFVFHLSTSSCFPWEYSEVCANLTLILESGLGASMALVKYSLPKILDRML